MRATRIAILPLLAGSVMAHEPSPHGKGSETRSDAGLIERTGISLVLVEVVDDEGQPVRGLTRDDFEIQLNGNYEEIHSLDDLCDGSSSPAIPAGPGAAETGRAGGGDRSAETLSPAEPERFRAAADAERLGRRSQYAGSGPRSEGAW